ncbi:cupredoxin domain-containing protein [Effusibacillus lacus]|uniref:EfeO-type cupredoxin-like domain-containing protein n=1 Tax=Effusibacillus lacus TaxID=1348429 RepID=A0A292YT52_9BACL|nr:cupredoxin domain-containing protein [Effusibacillus lacus]TCS74993.1 putative cupredoxin-like copper-binding protein [Effusibacillus lacus]GAX91660.1 hypothetical protein EFBL_3350 [Effusibacillus lacus]
MNLKEKYTRLLFVLLFAAMGVLTVYWGKNTLSSAQADRKTESKHVEIQLKEWEIVPRNITLNKGETVQLSIINKGAYPHDFVVHGLNIKTGTLAPGQKEALTFVADQPMTLETFCTLAGHKEAGMVANLSIK